VSFFSHSISVRRQEHPSENSHCRGWRAALVVPALLGKIWRVHSSAHLGMHQSSKPSARRRSCNAERTSSRCYTHAPGPLSHTSRGESRVCLVAANSNGQARLRIHTDTGCQTDNSNRWSFLQLDSSGIGCNTRSCKRTLSCLHDCLIDILPRLAQGQELALAVMDDSHGGGKPKLPCPARDC